MTRSARQGIANGVAAEAVIKFWKVLGTGNIHIQSSTATDEEIAEVMDALTEAREALGSVVPKAEKPNV